MSQNNDRIEQVVLLDAVGTLIWPNPGASETYFRMAREHGSSLSRQEIGVRFSRQRERIFDAGEPAERIDPRRLESSNAEEKDLWRKLVSNVIDDVRPADDLFDALWQHFAESENWRLFDDVSECVDQLDRMGYRLAVASNFDSRLNDIVRSFPALDAIQTIFCSGDVGFRKPSPAFYEKVQSSQTFGSGSKFLLVGDDFENDYRAPGRAGWHSVWLNRGESNLDRREKEIRMIESLSKLTDQVRQLMPR